MKRIPIFFAVNDSFVRYLCTALESLKDYVSKEVIYEIHVLYSTLSEDSRNSIAEEQEEYMPIHLNDVSEYFERKLKESYRWSKEIYYRLIIPYIFTDMEKALYFDADIIFQRDPKDLYDIDIGDNYIGAVFEPSNHVCLGNVHYAKEFVSFYQLRLDGNYFGSGVLAFNMKQFREHISFDDIINYIDTTELDYMDQDTLNYLCLNHTYGYPPNWNCIYQYYQFQMQLENTGEDLYIFHYAGKIKPDMFGLRGKFHLFWKYYQRTVFYTDEQYMKAITDYILDYSDEIHYDQIEQSVDETFNQHLCDMYIAQVNEWFDEGEVLPFACIYLLLYLSKTFHFEIRKEIVEKFDYVFNECRNYLK